MSARKDIIAVIEDSVATQKLYHHILSNEGYDVLQALTGTEGLTLIRDCHPDIILLDLMMPDISGEEICSIVRSDPDLNQTPIIMVTAKAGAVNAVRGLNLGADDYLSKPFDANELKARIQAILRRSRNSAQTSLPQVAAEHDDTADERTVHLFGVDWLGKKKGNQIFVATTPLCPKCGARLKKLRKRQIIFETLFWNCGNCGHKVAIPDNDTANMVRMVRTELEKVFLNSAN